MARAMDEASEIVIAELSRLIEEINKFSSTSWSRLDRSIWRDGQQKGLEQAANMLSKRVSELGDSYHE